MIEFLSTSRCTSCNRCVQVCPTDVFAKQVGGPPSIARQSECQTCFMCELYCPVDALYVAPDADRILDASEGYVTALGLLGSYRRLVGWSKGAEELRFQDETWKVFERS
jgi:NAD-dependent dihydropyrimidine dehydrogenase PreA subunit